MSTHNLAHTRPHGVATPTKETRCRLVNCPHAFPCADPSAESARRAACARCTGPIRWTDADGRRQGLHRACTSCPMNGLGLHVCWCGCDGPNPEFTTNGQKMVTTGGVGDSTGLIEQQMQEDCRTEADERAEARMLDALDGTVDVDGESYRRLPLEVARRLLNADTTTFDAFITAFRSHDYRHSAALLGVPSVAFRDTASESSRVAKAVCNLTGEAWSVIRHILNGESQERVGRLHGCVSTDGHVQVGISKQAVNKRVWNAIEAHPWIGVALGYTTGKYTTAHPPARARCRDTISEK